MNDPRLIDGREDAKVRDDRERFHRLVAENTRSSEGDVTHRAVMARVRVLLGRARSAPA